jgi:hypothetical protein
MAGSINDFRSSFNNDLARPNRFDVSIPVPLPLTPYLNTSRTLSFRCEGTQLPGRTLATADQKIGSNPTEKFPYHSTYNDVTMTFILSGDMSEKLFFDAWMEYINPTRSFDFTFKNDYTSTLTINQYDITNNLTYSVNLIDAYPVAIDQLDLEWTNNEYHKLTIDFAYTYWQNNSIQSLGSSLLQYGISNVLGSVGGLTAANFNAPAAIFGGGTGISGLAAPLITDANGAAIPNKG